MGMVYAHINVSVDGYINDSDGGLEWWLGDEEFNAYIDSVLDSIDGMVLGRVAYDVLVQFWPVAGPEISETQRQRMHELPKYVLSNTPAARVAQQPPARAEPSGRDPRGRPWR